MFINISDVGYIVNLIIIIISDCRILINVIFFDKKISQKRENSSLEMLFIKKKFDTIDFGRYFKVERIKCVLEPLISNPCLFCVCSQHSSEPCLPLSRTSWRQNIRRCFPYMGDAAIFIKSLQCQESAGESTFCQFKRWTGFCESFTFIINLNKN